MPFEIKFSRTPGLLKVHVTGTRIPVLVVEEAKALWKRVAEEIEKDDHSRVLAIMDFTGNRSIFEAYQIFEDPGKFQIKRRTNIAIVYPSGDYSQMDKFSETVARNRAWNVMVFSNEPEAQKWLDQQAQ